MKAYLPSFFFSFWYNHTGGKGSSGNGEYRGKASFRTFTKSIVSYSHPCSPHCEAGGLR